MNGNRCYYELYEGSELRIANYRIMTYVLSLLEN